MADGEEWNQKAQGNMHDVVVVYYVSLVDLTADCGPELVPREHPIYFSNA